MGLTVPIDFSTSVLRLVGFDHDKGPTFSRSVLLKHFAPRARGASFATVSKVRCLNYAPTHVPGRTGRRTLLQSRATSYQRAFPIFLYLVFPILLYLLQMMAPRQWWVTSHLPIKRLRRPAQCCMLLPLRRP